MRIYLIFLAILCFISSPAQDQVFEKETRVIIGYTDSTRVTEPVYLAPRDPGALRDMFRFIGELLVYPEEALAEGIEGIVYVDFTVEPDGSRSDMRIVRGIGGGCDEEAMRVIDLFPNWRPGTKDGLAVAMDYRMPVKFKIRDK